MTGSLSDASAPGCENLRHRLWTLKVASRFALGVVWIYEGLVPKLLFRREDEIEIVRRCGIIWRSPEFTLQAMGVAMIAVGLWLFSGRAERRAVSVATVWMLALVPLVAYGNPSMLTEPYGAFAKDACLLTSALSVWLLAPIVPNAKD
jgi:hypothetical protein